MLLLLVDEPLLWHLAYKMVVFYALVAALLILRTFAVNVRRSFCKLHCVSVCVRFTACLPLLHDFVQETNPPTRVGIL